MHWPPIACAAIIIGAKAVAQATPQCVGGSGISFQRLSWMCKHSVWCCIHRNLAIVARTFITRSVLYIPSISFIIRVRKSSVKNLWDRLCHFPFTSKSVIFI